MLSKPRRMTSPSTQANVPVVEQAGKDPSSVFATATDDSGFGYNRSSSRCVVSISEFDDGDNAFKTDSPEPNVM
jgi:hypothetical protein